MNKYDLTYEEIEACEHVIGVSAPRFLADVISEFADFCDSRDWENGYKCKCPCEQIPGNESCFRKWLRLVGNEKPEQIKELEK